MSDEEIRLAGLNARERIGDVEVWAGNELPTREQDPYIGEWFRRTYTKLGDDIAAHYSGYFENEGRRPSAGDVAEHLPGFPPGRMDDLRELLHVISRVGVWVDYPHRIIEDLAHNKLNEPRDRWLRFVAEGRLDDVYREMLWRPAMP